MKNPMKRIVIIFTALAFIAGIAVISCTKENTPASQAITSATDAVMVDNSVAEITGIIDDYEAANSTTFVSPAFKSTLVDGPMTMRAKRLDSCVTVTVTKTLTATTANVFFKIDFGTTGCVGKDGKARRGTITSTYSWVKAGGWSRESAIDMYVSDIHHVGTQVSTFGVTGPYNHAYFTEKTSMTITAKDGSTKTWNSERQRELIEGNGGVNPVKIFKITGNSTFSNSSGESSSYTISIADPLIKRSDCKTFTSGTVTIVNKAGVTTTITYTVAGQTCPDGFTIKTPGDKNGKGAMSRFIKFGK